jgi:ATP-dependent Clp protease ATP-binding subunit ClpC
MFERYSEKAKRVIFFARFETSQFGSPVIDTEHLLLGILRQAPDSITSVAGADAIGAIREQIQQDSPVRGNISTGVDLPFSDAARKVLENAMEEADKRVDHSITPEHLLIGMLREEGCLAHRILGKQGIKLESLHPRKKGGDNATEDTLSGRILEKTLPNQAFRKVVSDAILDATLLRSMSAKPEHLLLGLLRDESSLAARILREAGLTYDTIRGKVKET